MAEYIHIQPAAQALDTDRFIPQLERLHSLDVELQDTGVLGPSTAQVGTEFLLRAPESTNPRLDYYITCELPSHLDTVERICADLFPPSYSLTRRTVDLADFARPQPPAAGLELYGDPSRRRDWQTRLTPYERFADDAGVTSPLASAAAILADAEHAGIYQVLVTPRHDYSRSVAARRRDLKQNHDSALIRWWYRLWGTPELPAVDDLPHRLRSRLQDLEVKDASHSFRVAARAVIFQAPDADRHATEVRRELESSFDHLDGDSYGVSPTPIHPDDAWDAIAQRHPPEETYDSLKARVPLVENDPSCVVADPAELPSLCLLGGTDLPAPAHRGLAPTSRDQTPMRVPGTETLEPYRTPGFTLGTLLDADGVPTTPVAVPPRLQPLHLALFGPTGSGKSILQLRAIHDNQQETDGADILFLPKGDGDVDAYLRAHKAEHGDLEDVYCFDCSEVVPALSFFDIRADLEAGVTRESAVGDRIDHYVELVRELMADGYDDAKRSPDVIRYLLRALFDPVHGEDVFTHADLHRVARYMRDSRSPPPVADDTLQSLLKGVLAGGDETFHAIMQGVLTRIEKVSRDPRLCRVFNHAPVEPGDHLGDAQTPARLDLDTLLNDDDAVIIIDTGSLRTRAQTAISTVVLSQIWTALQRRADQRDRPLVNCYIDEAAAVAHTDLLGELLAQSRSFGVSVSLAMQFPGQLEAASPATYREVLNNIGTILTGPVGHDAALAERLATTDMDAETVATRLRGLRRGEWLASLPAPFDERPPRPLLLASPDPPHGHPAAEPAANTDEAFRAARTRCYERARAEHGLPIEDAPGTVDDTDTRRPRVDSALPYTTRLPSHLSYDADRHALQCHGCEKPFDATPDGLRRACECCPEGDSNPDSIPICDVSLKLTPGERTATGYSDPQLMFLKAVHNAQQKRYTPPHFSLISDSMRLLTEYIDIDRAAVDELVDDGVLIDNGEYPHTMYSVSADGRDVIGEARRHGVDFGDGTGDLNESSLHVRGVEIASRWLQQTRVESDDSPAVEIQQYHVPDIDVEESAAHNNRLDVAALDDSGNVVITLEVERTPQRETQQIVADYDKMAACDPEEAIWVAMNRSGAHTILTALNQPLEGDPRVEKTYADTTTPRQFNLDAPGCTDITPVETLRNQLD